MHLFRTIKNCSLKSCRMYGHSQHYVALTTLEKVGVRNINTTGPSRGAVWVMTKEGHFGNEEHCGKSDIVGREGGAAVNAVVSSTGGRQEMRQVNYGLLCAFYDVVARRTPCQRSWQAMTTTTDT